MYGGFTYKVGVFYGTGGYGEEEMMCFRVSFERKILERSVKFFLCEIEILMTYILVETQNCLSSNGGNSFFLIQMMMVETHRLIEMMKWNISAVIQEIGVPSPLMGIFENHSQDL